MINAVVSDTGVVFDGDLPLGSAAYVDREWLPDAGSGSIPALVVSTGDRDETAAAALLTVVQSAASAAQPGSIEVVGRGILAHLLRLVAGDAVSERPDAIVETTGDPAAIASALERVADLGTVVLAGESLGRGADLDLYRTVHVRGLTLVGIAPPVAGAAPLLADSALLLECREALVPARIGERAANGGAWYRVSGAEPAEP